jgi:AcrR family transcriptional regulator
MTKKAHGPKKAYHWGEKLEGALIDEAVRRVEPMGIGALSTREVARAVGVSHAAPKHYFPDKLALIAAVASAGFERMYTEVADAVKRAGSHPPDQIVAAGTAYVEFALENRGLYRTMFAPELTAALEQLRPSTHPGPDHFANLAQLKAKVFSLFIEIVREGQERNQFRRGKPDDLARGATALANGLSHEFIDEGLGSRIDRLAHARQVFGVILTGLEVRQDRRPAGGKRLHL